MTNATSTTVTHSLPLYADMEAKITVTPATSQGFWTSGLLFDRDAMILAERPNRLHLAMCHADGVAVILDQLLTEAGMPRREWEDGIWDTVHAAGLECDCEPSDRYSTAL